MNGMNHQQQVSVCRKYGRDFVACPPDSKLGLAIHTLTQTPIHGLRHPPTAETNGWFIWAGEFSDSADFFAPLHTSHLPDRLPEVIPYLGLPPGSRFLLADGYVDVWFDDSLLNM